MVNRELTSDVASRMPSTLRPARTTLLLIVPRRPSGASVALKARRRGVAATEHRDPVTAPTPGAPPAPGPGPTRSRRRPRPIPRRSRRTRTRARSELDARSAETPTEAVDYAAPARAYGALLAGTAVERARPRADPRASSCRARGRDLRALEADRPREGRELAARAVRGRAGRRRAQGPPPALRGRRAAHLHALHGRVDRARARRPARCTRPRAGRTVTTVLAASAGNDMLQAGFSWLCARRQRAAEPAALPRPVPVNRSSRLSGAVDVRRVLEQLGRPREVEQPPHGAGTSASTSRTPVSAIPLARASSSFRTAESMNVTRAKSSTSRRRRRTRRRALAHVAGAAARSSSPSSASTPSAPSRLEYAAGGTQAALVDAGLLRGARRARPIPLRSSQAILSCSRPRRARGP